MSMILALPVRLSMMFEGFRSPWTMPSRCRAASAARHSRTTWMATPGLSRGCTGPRVTITSFRCSQRLMLDALVGAVEHIVGHQLGQVVAVDPLHFHHADPAALDEVVDVEQVVLLDLGHAHRDVGNAGHGLVVAAGVFVAGGREDFQGHRQREVVGPPPLAQVDHPLSAGAEAAREVQVLGPAHPLAADDRFIAIDQLVGLVSGRLAVDRDGGHSLLKRRRVHACCLPPCRCIVPAACA